MAWVLDLDGVVWLGGELIPGVPDAVAALRDAGESVVFATNNASRPVADHEERLGALGIPAEGAVVTSAMAAATLVAVGERAVVVGGPGVHEAVAGAGAIVVDEGPADVVVAGMDRDLRYDDLRRGGLALRAGARFVLTNDDATYPTPHGQEPGAGSIGAALAVAGGVTPTIAGKPHAPMAHLVRSLVGDDGIMVGDRPETDGRFAEALGYRFGLVLSGVTGSRDLPVEPTPWRVADDLPALVAAVLGG